MNLNFLNNYKKPCLLYNGSENSILLLTIISDHLKNIDKKLLILFFNVVDYYNELNHQLNQNREDRIYCEYYKIAYQKNLSYQSIKTIYSEQNVHKNHPELLNMYYQNEIDVIISGHQHVVDSSIPWFTPLHKKK